MWPLYRHRNAHHGAVHGRIVAFWTLCTKNEVEHESELRRASVRCCMWRVAPAPRERQRVPDSHILRAGGSFEAGRSSGVKLALLGAKASGTHSMGAQPSRSSLPVPW